ncbi:hypothetical protein L2090_16220 [Rahnella victoriana]|nr:hypothetical protein [Rahnella victoriana]
MRSFKWLSIIPFIFYSMHTYADGELENSYCYNKAGSECQITLVKKGNTEQDEYKSILVNARDNSLVFNNTETSSTMETLSFFRVNNNYVILKEYLDSTKALEFSTFYYGSHKAKEIKYFYIESSVNFIKREKEWSGRVCTANNDKISQNGEVTLLELLAGICGKISKLSYHDNNYYNNDVFFKVSDIADGNDKGDITLVALDSKGKDSININDLGCSNNCAHSLQHTNYIGRLNNKIRVKMHLEFNNDQIVGYYYYDKIQEKIPLIGKKNNHNIELVANLDNGQEKFNGIINDGQIKGEWSSTTGNKKLPFDFFSMLTQ